MLLRPQQIRIRWTDSYINVLQNGQVRLQTTQQIGNGSFTAMHFPIADDEFASHPDPPVPTMRNIRSKTLNQTT